MPGQRADILEGGAQRGWSRGQIYDGPGPGLAAVEMSVSRRVVSRMAGLRNC